MIRSWGDGEVVSEIRVNEVGEKKVKVASFRIKSAEKLPSKTEGEEKSVFTFRELEVWDSAAEYVQRNVEKGDTIVFSGRDRTNSWASKDKETGEEKKNYKDVIRVEDFRVIKASK
jgi:single-stranded DNA-binding protein